MSLNNLAIRWEQQARRQWIDAKKEKGMKRKALEYGALIYQNCARELREALKPVLLEP